MAGAPTGRRSANRRCSPSLLCWAAYLTASPFYVFESGYPQPAAIFMAVFMAFNMAFNARRLANPHRILEPLLLFVAYTTIVNLLWYAIYNESFFLWSALFYIYNALLMYNIILIYIYNGDCVFVAYTKYGLLCAIAIELIVVFSDTSASMRKSATFNDPNQFGYWLVLVGSCWLALRIKDKLTMMDGVFLAILLFLIANTVSRSSMLASCVLLAVALLVHGVRRSASLSMVGLGFVAAVAIWSSEPARTPLERLAENAVARWEEYKSGAGGDETFAGRGYARIWTYPQHLLFGAGEGAYQRFGERDELHSSLGTILFSYGIIGFTLFVGLLRRILRGGGWLLFLYTLPFLVYGTFNYGLRFSFFWMFLAVLFCMNQGRPGDSPGRRLTMRCENEDQSEAPRRPVALRGLARAGLRLIPGRGPVGWQ